jgi:predicted RNA-binding protein YlxR (DUF448 family)
VKPSELFRWLQLFFEGATLHCATEKLQKRAYYLNQDLITLILSDQIGIPNPLYYHSVELLPYLWKEVESWKRAEKKSALGRALSEFGEP